MSRLKTAPCKSAKPVLLRKSDAIIKASKHRKVESCVQSSVIATSYFSSKNCPLASIYAYLGLACAPELLKPAYACGAVYVIYASLHG